MPNIKWHITFAALLLEQRALMDEKALPASEFKELYHLRWGAEENYKRLKQWVEIENFSGKYALLVKQEFLL